MNLRAAPLLFGLLASCSPGEKVTSHYPDGMKKMEGHLGEEGQKQGLWTYWNQAGGRALLAEYEDGKQHGLTTAWHSNGQKGKEGEYKNGKAEGRWTYWHENGQKSFEGRYTDGAKEGAWTTWYENGQKEEEGSYEGGKKEGMWTEWRENGKKSFEGQYKDGERVPGEPFVSNIDWDAFHKANPHPPGMWFPYPSDAGPVRYGKREGVWTTWHENGQKRWEGFYKNGEKAGTWTAWYENGQKLSEHLYKYLVWTGVSTKTEVRDRALLSETYWYENGQKWWEGSLKDGKKEGTWTWWNEDGTVDKTEQHD